MTKPTVVTAIWFLPQWGGYSYRFTNEAGDAMCGHAWRNRIGKWEHYRISHLDTSHRCGHLLEAHDGVRREGQFPNTTELAAINLELETSERGRLK